MKTIKNILLSLLFSNAISSNILVVCHLIFRLIAGNFEYKFSLLNYCVIAGIIFIVFLFMYEKFDIINNPKINHIIHMIILLISIICFGVYGFILDYYTLDKFVLEKSSDIYNVLNDVLFVPFISALLIEISDRCFKRKNTTIKTTLETSVSSVVFIFILN